MKNFVVALGVLGLVNAYAMGGTVTFSPPSGTSDVPIASSVPFDVTVAVGTLSGFNGVTLVVGSDEVPVVDFQYSGAANAFANRNPALIPAGIYAGGDALVDANNPAASVGTTILLGTVFVDTSSLGQGASFTLKVDSDSDFGISTLLLGLQGQPLMSEGLSGSASYTTVPEPATLCLIGLSGLAFLRRRRTN